MAAVMCAAGGDDQALQPVEIEEHGHASKLLMAAVRAHGTMTGDTFAASQAGAFSTLPPEQRTDITTFLASPVAPMPGQGPTTPHTRTVAELSAEEKLSKAFEYAKGRRDAAWDAAELASHRRWVGSSGSAGERLAIGPLRYETLTSPARLYGGARLIRAELVNVQLASADLSEVDLLEAVLRNVILRRAKLRNARTGRHLHAPLRPFWRADGRCGPCEGATAPCQRFGRVAAYSEPCADGSLPHALCESRPLAS